MSAGYPSDEARKAAHARAAEGKTPKPRRVPLARRAAREAAFSQEDANDIRLTVEEQLGKRYAKLLRGPSLEKVEEALVAHGMPQALAEAQAPLLQEELVRSLNEEREQKRVAAQAADQAEAAAQVRYDYWLLNEWRRRDPTAFKATLGGLPFAHTDLWNHAAWSPDEQADSERLVQAADAALTEIARQQAFADKPRLLVELKGREAAKEQRQRAIRMAPDHLLREVAELERSLRWTSPNDLHERRRIQLLLNATRQEARRRGLRPPRGEP